VSDFQCDYYGSEYDGGCALHGVIKNLEARLKELPDQAEYDEAKKSAGYWERRALAAEAERKALAKLLVAVEYKQIENPNSPIMVYGNGTIEGWLEWAEKYSESDAEHAPLTALTEPELPMPYPYGGA
jgi:hypothetical protein